MKNPTIKQLRHYSPNVGVLILRQPVVVVPQPFLTSRLAFEINPTNESPGKGHTSRYEANDDKHDRKPKGA